MALGDKQIAEENAAFLADPAAQAEAARQAEQDVERWAAWAAAEKAAGPHAAVVPIKTAEALIAALTGQPTDLDKDLLVKLLTRRVAIAKAAA
jgi:hypothetical protein